MILVPVVFNSWATIVVFKHFSTQAQSNPNETALSQQSPQSSLEFLDNGDRENNFLVRNLVYSLPFLLPGVSSYLAIVFLSELARSPRQNKTPTSENADKFNLVTKPEDSDELVRLDEEAVAEMGTESEERVKDNVAYNLLADMSHELRSPLNAILGFAQIMQQEATIEVVIVKKNVAIIHRSGEHLLAIINDVVDLAKIETKRLTLENKDLDFYAWLDSLEQSLCIRANRQGWQFSLVRQPNLPQYIRVDERRLRQILQNLVNYCLSQFSSASEISIGVDSQTITGKKLRQDRASSVRQCQINFKIFSANFVASDRDLATLFDPLVRVQQSPTEIVGSSLNLPLSFKLARLAGGDITVPARGDRDASLVFQLKIEVEGAMAVKTKAKPPLRRVIGLESGQTKYRILVVDDSRLNRVLVSQLLESVGFQVKEAVNGEDAVDTWFRWRPHMILMDLKMPVMNGYEATELIKSYSESFTPIVALSASTLEEEESLLNAVGCDDFVGKPFSENVIFDKIAQHLGIRYLYEPVNCPDHYNFRLTADSLKVMPNEWLERVERAATVLDRRLLTQLLQEIPSEHSQLKAALEQQIDNFEFDRILDLVKRDMS